jgi:hypothetical protein
MTAKQIVDRIAGKPDEDWSLAQCRVVEHAAGETFGLQCHARQGNTGVMRSFEIPLSRQRAFRIVGLQAAADADTLSWELNNVFVTLSDQVRCGGGLKPV